MLVKVCQRNEIEILVVDFSQESEAIQCATQRRDDVASFKGVSDVVVTQRRCDVIGVTQLHISDVSNVTE